MSVAQPPASSAGLKPHEIEMQRKRELLQKVRSIREGLTLNRGAVLRGDPAKAYMWVNTKEDRRIFYEQMGFEVVKVNLAKPEVVTQCKPREDGTLVRGDVILYQIDKDLLEALDAYNVVRGLELTEGAGNDFEDMMERFKVPSYRPKV